MGMRLPTGTQTGLRLSDNRRAICRFSLAFPSTLAYASLMRALSFFLIPFFVAGSLTWTGSLNAQDATEDPRPTEETEEASPEDKEEEKDSGGGGFLGRLRKSASDLKDSANLDKLGGSIGGLKDALVDNVEAIKDLKTKIDELEERIESLETFENEASDWMASHDQAHAEGDSKPVSYGSEGEMPKILASELSAAYSENSRKADQSFLNSFVEVSGNIMEFKNSKEIIIVLKPRDSGPPIACHFIRNRGFEVEVMSHEDRLANRADRSTYLQVGHPVKIQGTCKGYTHNVVLTNCKVVGAQPKPMPVANTGKK